MGHEEAIKTPLDRINLLLETLEEQQVIQLDMYKATILNAVQNIFDKNTKNMYDIIIKPRKAKTKAEIAEDEDFDDFLKDLDFDVDAIKQKLK